ncbi:hypothetical protein SAY87_025698 [Trapa incisa]|uniref:Uncharacterized protein n=1 Tax=Trapa incisa TaxID=236973 RepID=A0AAN7JCI0_9MYRT|nr:hypothetical protein SAY87_025698 [Trapa incisa]
MHQSGLGSGSAAVLRGLEGSNVFLLQGRLIFGPDVSTHSICLPVCCHVEAGNSQTHQLGLPRMNEVEVEVNGGDGEDRVLPMKEWRSGLGKEKWEVGSFSGGPSSGCQAGGV